MRTRVITATVLIALLVPILVFSGQVPFLIPGLMAIMSCIAVFELFRCIGVHRDLVLTLPAYPIAVALPLCTVWAGRGVSVYLTVAVGVLTLYLLYLFTVAVFRRGTLAFSTVATAFTMVTYIVVSLTSFALLRHHVENGQYLYLLVFIGAWVTDTFAYFTGILFGRHKLNPEISPKKTVEGSIGGVVFCVAGFCLFGWIVRLSVGITPRYWVLALLGLLCGLVSQIGDLITSLIKRERGIKDFGNVFPGHGGVLDRFDSVLSVAPVLLIYCEICGASLSPLVG